MASLKHFMVASGTLFFSTFAIDKWFEYKRKQSDEMFKKDEEFYDQCAQQLNTIQQQVNALRKLQGKSQLFSEKDRVLNSQELDNAAHLQLQN